MPTSMTRGRVARSARPMRLLVHVSVALAVCALAVVAAQPAPNPLAAAAATTAPPTTPPPPTEMPETTPPEPEDRDDLDDVDLPEPEDPSDSPSKSSSDEPKEASPIDETSVPPAVTNVPEPEAPTLTDPPVTEPPAPSTVATPPSKTPAPTTTRPAIRTDTGDAVDHSAHSPASVSPTMFILFAVMCSVFLALWSRRNRTASEGTDGSSPMSGMETTSSKEKVVGSAGEPKVQYSRIDNQRVGGDFEDEEDAEFGRHGSWDDWENNHPSHQITVRSFEDEDDRGTGKLTRGMGSSSSSSVSSSPPRSSGGRLGGVLSSSTAKVASPPPSQTSRLQDILLAEHSPSKPTSVASSSSSNESFEVVPPHPIDLLSGSLSPPRTQPAPPPLTTAIGGSAVAVAVAVAAPSQDDLFSQFGMVPTFKKGVQQPPAPSLPTSALNPFAYSEPAPVSTSTSSASLFAADLSAAATDWGDEEDDDWVQGL